MLRHRIATTCLRAQENDETLFAEAVAILSEAGFEGYTADLRRAELIPEEIDLFE